MAAGKDIAERLPSPDKIKGGGGSYEPDADEGAADDGTGDEDKAARVATMQEVIDAFNEGNAEAACDAMDRYSDLRK